MDLNLSGMRVLVTGGSTCLGAAIATEFAAEHAATSLFIDGGMTDCPDFSHGG